MENTRKSEAIDQVLRDMENLTREELLEEIYQHHFHKFRPGQVVGVDFALGPAEVVIKSFGYNMQDGSIIYHVSDTTTGHEDFVGQEFIKQL
jgi:hypothetical protein